MAANADSVIVELIAKTDNFDAKVKQSAASFDRAADSVEKSSVRMTAAEFKAAGGMDGLAKSFAKAETSVGASASRMSGSARQVQQQMRNLGFQIGDIGTQLSTGTSPFIVLAQQGPQVANALTGASGAVGKFATFLSGPYGAAVLAATTLLGAFLLKNRDTSESVDDLVQKLKENAEKARLAEEAHRIFDTTVEGSIAAMNKLTDEIDKQNRTLEDNIALKKQAIAGTVANVVTNIGTTSTDLAKAVADYRRAQSDFAAAEAGTGAGSSTEAVANLGRARSDLEAARKRVADLTDQLNRLSASAIGGARALGMVDFPLIERNAKNAVDPIAQINQKYDQLADRARKAGTYTQALANDIERQRKAALDAAQATERLSKAGTGQFGRTVSFAGAADIARAAGLNVTSAYRSTADQARLFNDPRYNHPGNPVARPGTSAHEGVNGKWALDIAFAPGLTAQSLKKLYGDEGVSLSAVYKESGHFHIEGSRTPAEIGADRAAARTAAEQQRLDQQMSDRLHESLGKEQEVTVAKEEQSKLSHAMLQDHLTIADILERGLLPSLEEWDRQYEQLIASQKELNHFGEDMIDTIFNPDNWRSWGDLGKTILRELESEFLTLAAINPLKNLLTGGNLPTLGSVFDLFGGGSGGIADFDPTSLISTTGGISHFAGGGAFKVNGGTDTNLLSINGVGRAMVSGDETIAVIPNNARAASPWSGHAAQVFVGIEASEYFDGRVLRTTGPVMAQVGAAAANGGATISRRNLSRESMHRLD